MPKAPVVEDDPYPLPEDTLLPAELMKCEQVTVEFNKRDGSASSFVKWEWTYRVADGEYAGFEIRASTEPKITSATEASFLPLARPHIEALLGRAIQLGEEIDTDDLVGLPCQVTARHLEPRPRKNGEGYWFNCEVDEIFPYNSMGNTGTGAAPSLQHSLQDEPPF